MRRPDVKSPRSIRYRMRLARFRWIENVLDQILADKPVARVLDIGGLAVYWRLLDPAYHGKVEITVLNLPGVLPARGETVQGLSITFETGDGTDLSQYEDQAFDLAHSNSVIEHVGLYSSMARFASETRRVGRAYYVQTPNFWFPLEPHYGLPLFHWLPENIQMYLHSRTGAGFASRTDMDAAMQRVDHTRLISRGLMRHLFPDAIHETEFFIFMPKSLIAIRPWLS